MLANNYHSVLSKIKSQVVSRFYVSIDNDLLRLLNIGDRLVHVTMSHRYVFSHFALILTVKWKIVWRLKLKRNLFWNLSELIKMFSWKSITKIPIPTFAKSSEKGGVGILVIDFRGNTLMTSDRFQNLQNKFRFDLKRHSTLRGQAVIHTEQCWIRRFQ